MMTRYFCGHKFVCVNFSSIHVKEHFASQKLGLLIILLGNFPNILNVKKLPMYLDQVDLWCYGRNPHWHLGQTLTPCIQYSPLRKCRSSCLSEEVIPVLAAVLAVLVAVLAVLLAVSASVVLMPLIADFWAVVLCLPGAALVAGALDTGGFWICVLGYNWSWIINIHVLSYQIIPDSSYVFMHVSPPSAIYLYVYCIYT